MSLPQATAAYTCDPEIMDRPRSDWVLLTYSHQKLIRRLPSFLGLSSPLTCFASSCQIPIFAFCNLSLTLSLLVSHSHSLSWSRSLALSQTPHTHTLIHTLSLSFAPMKSWPWKVTEKEEDQASNSAPQHLASFFILAVLRNIAIRK